MGRQSIKKEQNKLKVREDRLSEQRVSVTTPEEIQRWQQRWDWMTADKEVLQQRQQKHQEHLQYCEAKRMRQQQKHEMEEARRRQERERVQQEREVAKLQRGPKMLERRRIMQELALSRNNTPTPSPDSVLRLVFDYLSPVPGPACTAKELVAHLLCLQRVAAVNREWRTVALPLFYRTVLIVIGYPLDPRDVDDSDDEDGGYNITDSNRRMNIDEKRRDKTDTVVGSDVWDSDDDEEWLNAVGLSRDGVDTSLRTNIGLLCAAGLREKASEVQIIVQGMGQTAGQLMRQLLLAEFGRHMWPAAARLRIDMRGSSILRTHSESIYGCVPIEQLIKERLHRPESLRVVRVNADCWPKLTDDYETGITAPPIYIECMEIDAPDETYLMPVPTMMADTLVELKLSPMVDGFEWSPLYYSDDSDEEIGFFEDEVQKQLKRRFKELPDYGALKFPVLTSLELRNHQTQRYLRLFAYSPISSLVLNDQYFESPKGWNLSKHRSLRRLSIIMPPSLDEHDIRHFIKVLPTVLSTVRSKLQHLSLAMNLGRDTQLLFTAPSFADSLTSLTLEGDLIPLIFEGRQTP
ncbi:hypothetical protein GGH93_005947, partial [Coemansia aciculifera]